MRRGGVEAWRRLREGVGEVEATGVTLVGVFRQRSREDAVEVREMGFAIRYPRGRRTQVVTDHDSTIGVLEGRRAGQQVKSCGSQRILIRPAVERLAAELLGGHIADGSHRDVVVGEVADVIDPASDAEVGQEHPSPPPIGGGHEDVLGLDVTMEQPLLMRGVERIGHRRHDLRDIVFGHAARI